MARSPRYIEANQMVEVTFKTAGDKFLLRPSKLINWLILSVLARALSLFEIQLHGFVFMSNHVHLLLSAANANLISRFLSHLKGNLARGIKLHTGHDANVWQGRCRIIPVLDDAAAVDRLRYIIAHGAKEHLVGSSHEWPGVHCVRALTGEESLVGTWIDQAAAYEDSRRAVPLGPASYEETLPIELAPIPCWAGLTREEYQARCRALAEEEAAKAAADGVPPLGVDAILAADPGDKPATVKKTAARPCHTTDDTLREAYVARRKLFLAAYRAAAEELNAGREAVFPPGCFPPRGPFVPFPSESPVTTSTSCGGVNELPS
jgi:REP element-mobilizing transposase RayT